MGSPLRNYTKYLAAIAFLIMLAANYAVNAFRVNGTTTGAVSDAYPNLFAPIGLTFAIWGVIYLLLGLYTLRQLGIWRGKNPAGTDSLIHRITPLFIATSLINTLWVFAWQYKIIWLSLILIACLLAALAGINHILDADVLTSGRDKWLVKLPFSVYFGWVTVATIANMVAWLVSIRWNGWGLSDQFWTIAVMAAGVLIGIITALRFRSAAYILVFAWAYLGILLKHVSPQYFDNRYPFVVLCAILSLAVFIFTAVFLDGRLISHKSYTSTMRQ